MSKIYYSYFKGYLTRLAKLQVHYGYLYLLYFPLTCHISYTASK